MSAKMINEAPKKTKLVVGKPFVPKKNPPVLLGKVPPAPNLISKKASKVKLRVKEGPVRKVKANKPAVSFVKVVDGMFKKKRELGCLNPDSIILDLPNVWAQIGNIIDALIERMMIDKLDMFAFPQPNTDTPGSVQAPDIYPTGIKAYLLLCAQYYFSLRGLLSQLPNATNYLEMKKCKVPMSFAKILQYYAPYRDFTTGSTIKPSIPPLSGVTCSYQQYSIDQPGSTSGTNGTLGVVGLFKMACPTIVYNSGSPHIMGEYAINSDGTQCQVVNSITAPVPLNTFWNTINTQTFVQKMIDCFGGCVDVDQIPCFAPDASLYSFGQTSGMRCQFSEFSNEMGIIVQGAALDIEADLIYPTAYDSPYPPTFNTINGVQFTSQSQEGQATLLRSYFYALADVDRWESGDAHSLLRHTIFEGAKSFVVRSVRLTWDLINGHIIDVITAFQTNADIGNSVAGTRMLSIVVACYTGIILRIYRSWRLMWFGEAATFGYYKFVMGNVKSILRLPPSFNQFLQGIGPVVVKGKIFAPCIDGIQSYANVINGTTGAWSFNGASSMFTTALALDNAQTSINVTNAQGTALTIAPGPNGYTLTAFNIIPALLSTFLLSESLTNLTQPYGFSKWVKPSTVEMGIVHRMLSQVSYKVTTISSPNTQYASNQWRCPTGSSGNWVVTQRLTKDTVKHYLCTTLKDSNYVALYGFQQFIGGVTDDVNFVRPQTNALKQLVDGQNAIALREYINYNLTTANSQNANEMRQAELGILADKESYKTIPRAIENKTIYNKSNDSYRQGAISYYPYQEAVITNMIQDERPPTYQSVLSDAQKIAEDFALDSARKAVRWGVGKIAMYGANYLGDKVNGVLNSVYYL